MKSSEEGLSMESFIADFFRFCSAKAEFVFLERGLGTRLKLL